MPLPSFRTVLHADWSIEAGRRWLAEASRTETGWEVAAPAPVGDCAALVDRMFRGGGVLAGFDFPIGLPVAFGRMTGLEDFPAALDAFGQGPWAEVFAVAEQAEQIAVTRPFYPRVSSAAAAQRHLLDALGLDHMDALRRRCERATPTRPAACSVFWTLGANQVGKAAIAGWRDVLQPARARGARLWPFDGSLEQLAWSGAPVLAETYPAEVYRHVGVRFAPGMSKRRQEDQRLAMGDLADRAARHGVRFGGELAARVAAGFGPSDGGEDAFDALIGLLGMLEVVDGRRPAAPATAAPDRWEGWIIGQSAG